MLSRMLSYMAINIVPIAIAHAIRDPESFFRDRLQPEAIYQADLNGSPRRGDPDAYATAEVFNPEDRRDSTMNMVNFARARARKKGRECKF